jgi:hypothetical protein
MPAVPTNEECDPDLQRDIRRWADPANGARSLRSRSTRKTASGGRTGSPSSRSQGSPPRIWPLVVELPRSGYRDLPRGSGNPFLLCPMPSAPTSSNIRQAEHTSGERSHFFHRSVKPSLETPVTSLSIYNEGDAGRWYPCIWLTACGLDTQSQTTLRNGPNSKLRRSPRTHTARKLRPSSTPPPRIARPADISSFAAANRAESLIMPYPV